MTLLPLLLDLSPGNRLSPVDPGHTLTGQLKKLVVVEGPFYTYLGGTHTAY